MVARTASQLRPSTPHSLTLSRTLQDITTDNFQLPKLGPKLRQLQQEVVTGRGFTLLRGLPVQQYGLKRSATAYWGIGAYWGHAVPQNKQGHLLGHVRDIGEVMQHWAAASHQHSSAAVPAASASSTCCLSAMQQ
jgi:hypothetical protein